MLPSQLASAWNGEDLRRRGPLTARCEALFREATPSFRGMQAIRSASES